MKIETEKLINKLSSAYNFAKDKLSSLVNIQDDIDLIRIGGQDFNIYSGMTDSELDDLASFINSTTSDSDKKKVKKGYSIKEDLEVGKIYNYVPTPSEDDEYYNGVREEFLKLNPRCKILNLDGEDNTVTVTFDIPENDKEKMNDYIETDTVSYEVPVSYIQEGLTEISEDLIISNDESDLNQVLLIAINSEKEAITTYEMLLNIVKNEEQKNLLTKIYEDEKEHVSLLTGLQSSLMAGFVSDDNKEMLDNYAETTINTEPASEE